MPTQGDNSRPYHIKVVWHMVYYEAFTGTSDGFEEVVASVQGILSKNGLPPFLDKIG